MAVLLDPNFYIHPAFYFTAMARQDKVNLPSGMGGLTRYFDDYTSNIELKPGHAIIMAIIVMVIIIFLHIQGGSLLTLG
jgi:preprotein translocase subunit Sec61beta